MLVMRLEFWTGSRLTTGWLDPDDFTVKLYLGSPGKDERRVPRSIYSLAHILDWILSGTLLESGTEIKVWILSGLWSVSVPLVMEVEVKVWLSPVRSWKTCATDPCTATAGSDVCTGSWGIIPAHFRLSNTAEEIALVMLETVCGETTELGAMGLETEDSPLIAGSRDSSLGCGTSGGLRAGTECTREVYLGLLDLVGRDVLLALGVYIVCWKLLQ